MHERMDVDVPGDLVPRCRRITREIPLNEGPKSPPPVNFLCILPRKMDFPNTVA